MALEKFDCCETKDAITGEESFSRIDLVNKLISNARQRKPPGYTSLFFLRFLHGLIDFTI